MTEKIEGEEIVVIRPAMDGGCHRSGLDERPAAILKETEEGQGITIVSLEELHSLFSNPSSGLGEQQ